MDTQREDTADTAGDTAPVPECLAVAPTACPTPAPTYSDVAPIFQASCAECHDGRLNGPWPFTDYGHIFDWYDEIRSDLLDCSMPPPRSRHSLTSENRQMILTWIRCGLPE